MMSRRSLKTMGTEIPLTYKTAGVDTSAAVEAVSRLVKLVGKTSDFRGKGEVGASVLDIGHFASVINIGPNLGLAMSTDGVGTKLLVAQMMNKYDTVGIDCVAMNVNDVICVGAEPIAMLDYLAVEKADPYIFEQIGKGLVEGAKQARIVISGGETSQIGEMIRGYREKSGFDLVGMAIGTVPLDRIIAGQDIDEDDIIIGLRSSGVHSNGLTLARRVFFDKMRYSPDKYLPDLGQTIGEELLRPTVIYVQVVKDVLRSRAHVKALINITSDGFLNLNRVASDVGYVINHLPEPHPVFHLIQKYGQITDEEMFLVYNMGIGFCVVVSKDDADLVMDIAKKNEIESYILGHPVKSLNLKKKVLIEPRHLIGEGDSFRKIWSSDPLAKITVA
jgi:phosphoribosylformylglycinamidine cyclo-ligase